jgi:ketosteroid isomerase-like protein
MPDTPPDIDPIAAAAAIVHIQQLAIRYAVKVDQRDIAAVAEVYTPDIDCGHWGRGRDAVIKMYGENDSTMGVSIHQVTNHLVDLVDADHATGVVYLLAEHQQHDGSWARLAGAYHDDYERRNGQWFIAKRRLWFWYRDGDTLPATVTRDTNYRVFAKWPTLPEAWPSWTQFWSEHEVPAGPHASVDRR